MERLYAPWRMAYIDQPSGADSGAENHCIFCQKASQADDEANYIIARGELAFVLLNIYPYNNGHLMIAPYLHTALLTDLDDHVVVEMATLARKAHSALERAFHPQGYNLGMNLGTSAGAGIADHLHQHLVPRWNGDTNFMPVLAGVKVLPDSLDHSAALLRAAWE